MSKQFAHHHVHTDHSVLDGHASIKALAKHLAEMGQPGFSVTDHGTPSNVYNAWKAAKEHGLGFLPGIEAYVAPGDTDQTVWEPVFFGSGSRENKEERSNDVSGGGAYTHMTILAETTEGMHNMFKLNTLAWQRGNYKKPRMDIRSISEHATGLIATTGCPSGELQTRLRLGQWKEAMEYAQKMQDIFGKENYFLELMDHNMSIDLERRVRGDLMKVAKELNIPLLATNDLHYTRREDAKDHEHMLCIQSGSSMREPSYDSGGKRFAFEGEEYYAKSAEEMYKLFPEEEYPGAISNTLLIVERASAEFSYNPDLRPSVPLPEGHNEDSFLRQEAFEGLARKRPSKVNDPEYIARLEKELDVFQKKNFSGYMLVVSDFMRWAKAQGWQCGPARGSGGGSLLAFCTDITEIDPIPHGLIFERFLNPERDSPPDIDSDFDDINREKVIEYVRQKYGPETVAMIITFGMIKAKSAIKDIARIFEEPFSVGETLTKAIPPPVSGKEMALHEIFNKEHKRYPEAEAFREAARDTPNQELIPSALGIEGKMRSTGVHAAGVIMSSKPLADSIPLMMRKADGVMITQFDYPTCEALGLIKMDFLGIRNLTVIDKAIKAIERNHGVLINTNEIYDSVLDTYDEKTYKLLKEGRTLGVFQLDSPPIASLLKSINPDKFGDLSATIALYRPGPMGMNSHNIYANRKNGREPVTPIHPELEEPLKEILGETYGLCVAGDTLVMDANTGLYIRMDELQSRVESADGFETFSIAPDGTIEKKKVTHWFRTGKKKIYTITSHDGRQVRVSAEHPVLTASGWKEAKDLVPGVDHVASAGSAFEPVGVNASTITNNEASLMGYLVGDGYITGYQNSFTNSSPALLGKVESLAKSVFSDMNIVVYPRFRNGSDVPYTNHMYFSATPQGHGRGKGTKGTRYNDFQMNRWLADVMGYTEKTLSDAKFVPEAIFGSSNEVIRHFLAGLWDTDGHVSNSLTYLRTISKKLAFGVQTLLDRLGIHSYVKVSEKYTSSRGERTSYGVYVYDEIFWDTVLPLMSHPDKKELLKRISPQSSKDRGVNAELMRTKMHQLILNDERLPHWVRKRLANNKLASYKSIQSYMVRDGIEGIYASSSQVKKDAAFITLNSNVKAYLENYGDESDQFYARQNWSKINSVEISEEEDVYDITVEDNHNFFGNGIVLHNCVYQEQVMQITQKLAGYTLGEADTLRRIMGKKKASELEAVYPVFSGGMQKNGYSTEAVKAIWDTLIPFAEYGFNKSHSAGYGLISYITAYLKANYPAEFMAANLSTLTGDKDKTALYLEECRHLGLKVSPPSVSYSTADYTAVSGEEILVGLEAIRGVGHDVSNAIAAEAEKNGPFETLDDFLNRAPAHALSKGVLEGLAMSGALDNFGHSRRSMKEHLPEAARGFVKAKKKQDQGQFSLFDEAVEDSTVAIEIPEMPEYIKKDKLAFERQYLGLYVSDHPLSGITNTLDKYADTKIIDILSGNVKPQQGFGERKKITLAGVINSVTRKPTKKGEMFAMFSLEDVTGSIPCLMFPKTYARLGEKIFADGIFTVQGTLLQRDAEDDISFSVDRIEEIEVTDEGLIPYVLNLRQEQVTEESMSELGRILARHKGDMPVYVNINNGKSIQVIQLDESRNVDNNKLLHREVMMLFGTQAVS